MTFCVAMLNQRDWGRRVSGEERKEEGKRSALCIGLPVVVCEGETGKGEPSAIARENYKDYAQKGGLYFQGYVG